MPTTGAWSEVNHTTEVTVRLLERHPSIPIHWLVRNHEDQWLAHFDLELDAPGGIATVVGHRGLRLSGGQSQRLAAARAFAPRSAVTVVDDLSSALDVHTETALWHALRRDGRTVIAASHSPVALALADRIIRLESGRVVSSKSCNTSPEPSLVTMSVEHRAANERSSL